MSNAVQVLQQGRPVDSGNPFPVDIKGIGSITADIVNSLSTMANTSGVIGSASAEVLMASASTRKYALFVNDGSAVSYLTFGASGSAGNGVRLNASGGAYEINSTNLYTGTVYSITRAGETQMSMTEGYE